MTNESIEKRIAKTTAHGREVFADLEMDNMRRERCLCLNCSKMDYCPISKVFYDVCKTNGVALMVTRCAKYQYK